MCSSDLGSSADYANLEGVTTFRGSNYRDGGSYGEIPEDPCRLFIAWKKRIGGLDEWSGVGWTGQGSIVRWPADLRSRMNIVRGKKEKEGLAEVIYATLDGHIYFLDVDDGEETRKAINIGAPIKGSLAVDPRGIPLLYCSVTDSETCHQKAVGEELQRGLRGARTSAQLVHSRIPANGKKPGFKRTAAAVRRSFHRQLHKGLLHCLLGQTDLAGNSIQIGRQALPVQINNLHQTLIVPFLKTAVAFRSLIHGFSFPKAPAFHPFVGSRRHFSQPL